MKQGHILAIISLLLISLTSCEYDPHGIFERNLNKNVEAPDLEVVSLDLSQDKDTVVLLYNRVCFHFKSSNQPVSRVNFILDDSLLGSVESGNGFFDMRCDSLYTGNHRLKLEVYTYSGTGSIADSLGMEGFLFATREWTIKVLNTRYSTLTSTVSDGFLKLQWPEPWEKIPYYIVYRSNMEIGRVNSCEFIDKGYVGEGAEYYVRYYSPLSGDLVTYGWVEIPNEMELKFTSDENNHYTVEWGKLKYYAAVDTIVVLGGDGSYAFQKQKTADINLTGFEIPPSYFGQVRKYRLGLIPKYSNQVYSVFHNVWPYFVSPEINCAIGFPSPAFRNFNRISSSEFIYTAGEDSLFRYSTRDNGIADLIHYRPPDYTWSGDIFREPATSPDGSRVMVMAGSSKTVFYSPTHNFTGYKISDLSKLTFYECKIPVSNVGTGIVYSFDYKYLYDFENEKLLGSMDNSISLSDYNISPDGKYLFLSASSILWLYKYQDDTLTLEKEFFADTYPGFDYFNFMGDDPEKAVSWDKDSKEFSILACPGFTVLTHFTVWEDQILDIDYFNDRILSVSSKKLVVRSLLDGSVQEEIPFGPMSPWNSSMGKCYLCGNSIFSSNGARYFLN